MPSKRATARKRQPSPAPDTAKAERFADQLLDYAGITPDLIEQDLREGGRPQLRLVLAIAPLGLRWRLTPTEDKDRNILSLLSDDPSKNVNDFAVLNDAEVRWFLNQTQKKLEIERVLQRDPADPSKLTTVYLSHALLSNEREDWDRRWQALTPEEQRLSQEIYGEKAGAWIAEGQINFKAATTQTPARAIEQHGETEQWRRMLNYDKSFVQDGVRYFPLSAAAPVVQAPAPTILHWIKNDKFLGGPPLQSCYFAPSNQYFIGEDAIFRAANRFIKWPSQEPAGAVKLGETKDRSGYIRLPKMAQILGVDHHTVWRWATKGTAPIDRPLDVIKDPASNQYHIRQSEAAVLKRHVPRAGLHAGRRPRPEMQPR